MSGGKGGLDFEGAARRFREALQAENAAAQRVTSNALITLSIGKGVDWAEFAPEDLLEDEGKDRQRHANAMTMRTLASWVFEVSPMASRVRVEQHRGTAEFVVRVCFRAKFLPELVAIRQVFQDRAPAWVYVVFDFDWMLDAEWVGKSPT